MTGFIMLRHVNNEQTNVYWNKCYDCIRKYYPEHPIVIIDDNSNKNYITVRPLYKTTVIHGSYPGRGEFLPYYYYLHYKWFDTAVIIHDSVFVNSLIDFRVKKYKFLWDFEHHWDQIDDETRIIRVFQDKELLEFYQDKTKWTGCKGCMSIITHDYLMEVNRHYDFSKLIPYVLNRYNRCSFERVLACLLQKNEPCETLFGDINRYCTPGYRMEDIHKYEHLPLIKVWTGR